MTLEWILDSCLISDTLNVTHIDPDKRANCQGQLR